MPTVSHHFGEPLWRTTLSHHFGEPLWRTTWSHHFVAPRWQTTCHTTRHNLDDSPQTRTRSLDVRFSRKLLERSHQMQSGHLQMAQRKLLESEKVMALQASRRDRGIGSGEGQRRRLPLWSRARSTLRGLQRKDGHELEEQGRPFSGPSVGQMLRVGLYERSLPTTIYRQAIYIYIYTYIYIYIWI